MPIENELFEPAPQTQEIQIEILETSFFQVDIVEQKVVRRKVSENNSDLKQYIKDLVSALNKENSKRRFQFDSDTTEIRVLIDKMVKKDGDFQVLSEKSAKRLLNKEIMAQEEISHLTEIQKGVLFQAIIKIEGQTKIVIAKADQSEYLDDEHDFKKKSGIPTTRQIYKAFSAEFDVAYNVTNVLVYDTNTKISKYWWSNYLELTETVTDTQNTEKTFDLIEKELRKVKAKSRNDYNILHNRMLGYYRSNEQFDLSTFVSNVFTGYTPYSAEVDIKSIEKRLKALPDQKDFDRNFQIDKSILRGKKLKNIVPLTDAIELHINEHVDNITDIIKAEKIHGAKSLVIRTDKGYDAFSTNDNEQ